MDRTRIPPVQVGSQVINDADQDSQNSGKPSREPTSEASKKARREEERSDQYERGPKWYRARDHNAGQAQSDQGDAQILGEPVQLPGELQIQGIGARAPGGADG